MKIDYLIQSNTKGEPVISVPLRRNQLELLDSIIHATINQLQDEYTNADHKNFLNTKTELYRINKKIRFATRKLDDFLEIVSKANTSKEGREE